MAPNAPQPPGQSVFRLRIQLRDVNPVVWRRILVPGSIRMAKLSRILLAAMGWNNSHLHAFLIGDKRIGMCFDEYPEGEIDEKGVTVLQALRDERRFVFEYDFGDGWEHEVIIEELTWSYFGLKFAVCLDGRTPARPTTSAAPAAMSSSSRRSATRTTKTTSSMLEWADGPFDPAEFDLANANALMQKVR